MKSGQTSEKMVKILKIHGLVWFVWFDLGLRALNFNTVSECPIWVYDQGGHRAARAAKNVDSEGQALAVHPSTKWVDYTEC